MKYEQVINYLYSLERIKGSRLGLGRIKELLGKLDNPEKGLKVIHVAGTNGKGSVCAILDSVLRAKGYNVGMYTSPHLIEFRNRFKVNGKAITKKEFLYYFKKIKKHISDQTFFEVITAIAFLFFKDKKVDHVLLEVGLGGRLDATNVVKPLVSVITNISLEHTEILGKDIEQIAREKGGIIKKGIPVVTGAKGKALFTIRKIAKKRNSRLTLSKVYRKTNGKFDLNGYKGLKLNLKGNFQLENSGIAAAVVEVLNKTYSLGITKDNIKKGFSDVDWIGRLQFIDKNVLVDCAHNPAGMKALSLEIKELREKKGIRNVITIIGILNDKDVKKMIRITEQVSENLILVKADTSRAEEPEVIMRYVKDKKNAIIIEDVKKALEYAKKTYSKKDLILITGSCYVVGKALS